MTKRESDVKILREYLGELSEKDFAEYLHDVDDVVAMNPNNAAIAVCRLHRRDWAVDDELYDILRNWGE